MTARVAPAPKPSPRPARAKALRTKAVPAKAARPASVRKVVHAKRRPHRAAALRRAAQAAPSRLAALGPVRAPTPAPVSAMQLAEPTVFALIRTTICESGPPRLALASAPPPGVQPGSPEAVLPPDVSDLPPPPGVVWPPDAPPPIEAIFYPPGTSPGPRPPEGPPSAPPLTPEPPTAAIPEPGTWALLLAGFAGVGAALRRHGRARRRRLD